MWSVWTSAWIPSADTIIHTPEEIEGYAFLLNDKGELVDQERPDMFIPAAGGAIRSKMVAGEVGYDHDAASATDVFYAPIRSIRSPDGKSFWSVGISLPEAEIDQVADSYPETNVLIARNNRWPSALPWSSWS